MNYTTTNSKKLLTSILALFLVLGCAYTQVSFSELLQEQAVGPDGLRRCSSVEVAAIRRMNNPNLPSIQTFEEWLAPKIAEYEAQKSTGAEKNTVIQIPVVVHVIHNGEAIGTAPNITDAQVLSQIQVLNEDFRKIFGSRGYNESPVGADLEIEFVMAQTAPDGSATNGINRRNVNQDGVTVDDMENSIKPATIWEPTEYMNMWSVKFVTPDDNTLGYAQFPEGSGLAGLPSSGEDATTDGVVMRYQSFGTSDLDDGTFILDAPYDLGRTATHEVGHWIGLRHIWGDGLGCNLGAPAAGCSCEEDDFCDDTPNSDMANYGCPEDKTSPCDLPNPPTADMVENYMDYSDDPCMNIFTQDQKTRARTVMLNSPRRMELPFSPALFPPQAYVAFAVSSSSVTEGSSCNEKQVAVEVEISQVPSGTVTVTVGVTGGTADGDDYELVDNTIIFSSGTSTSANLLVSINEDTEIEDLESINLEIIAVDGAGAAANYRQEHTLLLADDDYSPELAGSQPGVTIFQESFSTGLGNWTQQSVGSPNVTWVAGSPVNGMAQSAYVARTDVPGNLYAYDAFTGANVMLISPAIDASLASSLSLSFDYICLGEEDATSGDLFDFGTVLYSCDNGQTWKSIGTPLVNEPMATDQTLNLPPDADGCANLRLAFRWENDELVGFDPPLSIDNVRLRGSTRAPVAVQENVNTANPPSYNFGPNATMNVYDPATGRLLMSLENRSSFDFGCTTISIDRSRTSAGTSAVNFWNDQTGNALTAKTFRVVTENTPGSAQNVMVRTYFTQAETIAWEIATGRSRTQLQIVTVANDAISSVNSTNFGDYSITVEPTITGTFNTSNVTLEAEFSTFLNVGLGAGFPGSPLPVNLLSFAARLQENGVAELNWVTAGEKDNDYFSIEHSVDGRNFVTIGQEDGAGDYSGEKNYRFYHDQPQAGSNYYRLVQYDFSGEFTYSPIKILERKGQDVQLEAYPNPVRSNLTITPIATNESDFEIRLLDTRGGIIQYLTLSSGTSMNIDLSGLQPGTYFLNWRTSAFTGTKTIVIVP